MTSTAFPDPDRLLAHADFVRRLAHSLVRDGGDDLAQDAFAAALRRPPVDTNRSFWTRVVGRLAANRYRGEVRRRRREAEVVAASPTPTPADVIAHEELRAAVVAALLRLDEPFRAALLLRYYEDLDATEIARRLGVPASTVRTRWSRGLERLRADLDRRHGGRRAWVEALAPWAAIPGGVAVARQAIALRRALGFGAAGALAVAAGWWAFAPPPGAAPSPMAAAQSPVAASAERRDAEQLRTAPRADLPATTGSTTPLATPLPAERALAELSGRVVDEGGVGVPGVAVTLAPWSGHLPANVPFADDRDFRRAARTDASGAFSFAQVPAGPVSMDLLADDGRQGRYLQAAPIAVEGPLVLRLGDVRELRPTAVLVRDAAGARRANERVEAFVLAESGVLHGCGDVPPLHANSDDHGVAWFDTDLDVGMFFVRTSDGLVGAAKKGWANQREVEVTLGSPATLQVRLGGADLARLAGTVVQLHMVHATANTWAGTGHVLSAPLHGDVATFAGLPAGTFGVSIESPAGLRLVTEPLEWAGVAVPNSARMPTCEVTAGADAQCALHVTAGAGLTGVVVDREGAPIAGARVHGVRVPKPEGHVGEAYTMFGAHVWREQHPYPVARQCRLMHVHTTTDASGRYELRGLQPGSYRVEVAADRWSFERREGVELADGATCDMRHELAASGVVQIATLGLHHVGLAPPGRPREPVLLAELHHGMGTFPGVAAGEWLVVEYPQALLGRELRVIANVHVVAGKTTWLDLRDRSASTTIRGRVLAAGRPVPAARVEFHMVTTSTDFDGSFTLRLGYAIDWRIQRRDDAVFCVAVDGVSHTIAWPGDQDRLAHYDVELHLGDHEIVLCGTARAADALPTLPVRFQFYGSCERAARVVGRSYTASGSFPSADGSLRIAHLPPGEYHVTARFASGAVVRASGQVPSSTPLVLAEPTVAPLTVRVVDGEGRPQGHRHVEVYAWPLASPAPADVDEFLRECSDPIAAATTGVDGVARCPAANVGAIVVIVSHGREAVSVRAEVHPVAGGEVQIVGSKPER